MQLEQVAESLVPPPHLSGGNTPRPHLAGRCAGSELVHRGRLAPRESLKEGNFSSFFSPHVHVWASFSLHQTTSGLINHEEQIGFFFHECPLPYRPGPPVSWLFLMILEGCSLAWSRPRETLSTAIVRGFSAPRPGTGPRRGPQASQHLASAQGAMRESTELQSRERSLKPTPVWPVKQALPKQEEVDSASHP